MQTPIQPPLPRSASGVATTLHPPLPLQTHDGDEPHFHEWTEDAKNAIAEIIWKTENIELTTVGIDIGSSTSHLMFARVHLQRKTQMLSSQFVVVRREILWRSPILLTPFLPDYTIDAERLHAFIEECYRDAGLAASDVDSGAVILTGEAIKRRNAEAIARIFASETGKFVCASAGHHLECVLAAHGSGATAISRHTHKTVLNVDIGGGTTKFALIQNGDIQSTCAVAVGGRLIARDDDGMLTRIEDPALRLAQTLDIGLRLGESIDDGDLDRLVRAMSEIVIDVILQKKASGRAKDLLLTEPLATGAIPHLITFTGGVSEYIYGREEALYGDIARPLAEWILKAFSSGRIETEMMDPGQGIRATVIGASQFSVQVSGKTIHLPERVDLPIRNVPVVFPQLALHREFDADSIATAIHKVMQLVDADASVPIALGIRWHGDPYYARLRELAEGIAQALDVDTRLPLILMVDGDIGRLLGHILEFELRVNRPVISIDGIQLREFDYVDLGEVIHPNHVVPVIIKSLLFPSG